MRLQLSFFLLFQLDWRLGPRMRPFNDELLTEHISSIETALELLSTLNHERLSESACYSPVDWCSTSCFSYVANVCATSHIRQSVSAESKTCKNVICAYIHLPSNLSGRRKTLVTWGESVYEGIDSRAFDFPHHSNLRFDSNRRQTYRSTSAYAFTYAMVLTNYAELFSNHGGRVRWQWHKSEPLSLRNPDLNRRCTGAAYHVNIYSHSET